MVFMNNISLQLLHLIISVSSICVSSSMQLHFISSADILSDSVAFHFLSWFIDLFVSFYLSFNFFSTLQSFRAGISVIGISPFSKSSKYLCYIAAFIFGSNNIFPFYPFIITHTRSSI